MKERYNMRQAVAAGMRANNAKVIDAYNQAQARAFGEHIAEINPKCDLRIIIGHDDEQDSANYAKDIQKAQAAASGLGKAANVGLERGQEKGNNFRGKQANKFEFDYKYKGEPSRPDRFLEL